MADTLINRSEATMNRNEIIFEVTEAPRADTTPGRSATPSSRRATTGTI